jgi:hypothetical protein
MCLTTILRPNAVGSEPLYSPTMMAILYWTASSGDSSSASFLRLRSPISSLSSTLNGSGTYSRSSSDAPLTVTPLAASDRYL